MGELGALAVFGLLVAGVGVVAVRLGILLGRRLDRAVTRDDEEAE